MKRKLKFSDIIRLEEGKISVSKLADELCWTINQIWHVIKRDNIKIPKIWYGGVKVQEKSIERFKEMRELKQQGWLVKQIALKYKLSSGRVSEILGREDYYKQHNLI